MEENGCTSNRETALQLCARLSGKCSLLGLDEKLFGQFGPNKKDTIELSGTVSSGKTRLLTQFIAKCLLPEEFGGLDCSAILLNTDLHFQASLLSDMMFAMMQSKDASIQRDEKTATILEKCLKNLSIINCYNSVNLNVTIVNLEDILVKNDKAALIALDSVTSFYWEDREEGGEWRIDTYVKNILEKLQRLTFTFGRHLIYTKPSECTSKDSKDPIVCTKTPELRGVNYKIQLSGSSEEGYKATVETLTGKREINYIIEENGIQWMNSAKRKTSTSSV